MKAKITFLALVCLAFAFMLALPSLAGTWRDDFEDGNLDGWKGLDPCWTVEDGECSGEFFNAPPNMMEIIQIGDTGWKDYTVKCRMKFAGAPGGFAGINYRDTGMMWGRYGFGIDADENTAEGWKAFQGAVTFPSKIPLPFALSKDTWYELNIIVEGDYFEFYINGKPAGEFEDNSIPSGKVGLGVRNAHVHFDDLIISGDDVEDGGSWDAAKHPEEKAVEPKGKLATSWGKLKTGY